MAVAAFLPSTPSLPVKQSRLPAAISRRPPQSCAPPPRRRRSVRVKRRYTSQKSDWEWGGSESNHDPEPISWRAFFSVDENVIKIFETLWSRSVSRNSIFARVTALGARVLRSVGEALERTLYPDTEKELVVEYGLTEPSPADKLYVDPLQEWQSSKVTYYKDSVGRKVYLQLDGATGVVAALDFRDQYEDCGDGDIDEPPLDSASENVQSDFSSAFDSQIGSDGSDPPHFTQLSDELGPP